MSPSFIFVGREDAIEQFDVLETGHGLCIRADGGLGKTKLLLKLIELSRERGWHVGSDELDALIDFYDLQNRSVMGLQRSIIARLGDECFPEFQTDEFVLRSLQKSAAQGAEIAKKLFPSIVGLRRRIDALFFQGLQQALTACETVLFFDTFEVVANRHVGRWFLEQLLPRFQDGRIVFAGRPRAFELPSNVQPFALDPWTQDELQAYFDARGWKFPKGDLEKLHVWTGGRPLLVDMFIYFRDAGLLDANEFFESNPAPGHEREYLEWALINQLVRVQTPTHQAIMDMAYLRQRFDSRTFALRQQGNDLPYGDIPDLAALYERLKEERLDLIVKARSEGQVLALHDEVWRMIKEHAHRRSWDFTGPRGVWKAHCADLYERVVKHYPTFVAEATSSQERMLLEAEQLAYELENDPSHGLALYEQFFERVRNNQLPTDQLFDFNELIWGEIRDYLEAEGGPPDAFQGREYELCYDQAEWLWSKNKFDACVDLYRLIVDRYSDPETHPEHRLDALAALGHSLMHTSRYEEARDIFVQGRLLAESLEKQDWLSAFQHNMGQLLQAMHQWDEARECYEQAVATAQGAGREALAAAKIHLGNLQALLGQDEAIRNCLESVHLRREVFLHRLEEMDPAWNQEAGYYSIEGRKARISYAYLRLGDAYRYARPSRREKALDSYERALSYLSPDIEYRYRSQVLQGLGNIYHGYGFEDRARGDLETAVRNQQQAFNCLREAITLNRDHQLDRLLPKSLHRISHVIFAVGQLEKDAPEQGIRGLRRLSDQVRGFALPEEKVWSQPPEILAGDKPFDQLGTFAEKAQRLFMVSSFEAEIVGDVNTAMDSLAQACELALYRGQTGDVDRYIDRAAVRWESEAYPKDLYEALFELIRADQDLVQERSSEALARYSKSVPRLAQGGGFGLYLLNDHLACLEWKIDKMEAQSATEWCDRLIGHWIEEGLGQEHGELYERIREIQALMMDKRMAGI